MTIRVSEREKEQIGDWVPTVTQYFEKIITRKHNKPRLSERETHYYEIVSRVITRRAENATWNRMDPEIEMELDSLSK